jgi:hypothetical protein
MRATLTLVLVAMVALVASGCGATGDQHFSEDHPLSFDYPGEWTLTRGGEGGDGAKDVVTVALDQPFDQVTLSRFTMKKTLPKGKNGFRAEVDRIVARLTQEAGGKHSKARVVRYGGMPGYQYTLDYPAGKLQLRNLVTLLFSGRDEFQILCQSTAENREELTEGCQTVLDSLELK